MLLRESFDWLKPSPLWEAGFADARHPDFFQPQLLEFDDDNFMAAFLTAAASRDTTALKAAVSVAAEPGQPIKLFQPAHGRFYLVTAALSCRVPGFPERMIQTSDGESVFFLLRKFVNGAEYGWVINGKAKSWQPLNGQPRRVLDGEERLPLFPATGFDQRKILVGYIPVASREVYAVAPADIGADDLDPRIEELEARFITPLDNKVIDQTANSLANTNPPTDALQLQALRLTLSVYLLVDLWDFLFAYLPDVAAALRDNPGAAFPAGKAAEKAQLMGFLAAQTLRGSLTLGAAIGAAAKQREALNKPGGADPGQLGFDATYDLSGAQIDSEELKKHVLAALPDKVPPIQLPKLGAEADISYAVRCIYERPQCATPQRAVSQASARFQLATFFDADAPARPVRIVMPTDLSIGGLRKFNKGVTFLISDSLQRKINRLTGHEKDLLKDPTPGLGDEKGGIAFMCSFSIQIIFIVAFFLLLMFVVILNIVFWWMAFFRICIPIPKKLLSG